MNAMFSKAVWSPYVAGALVGILAAIAVVVSTNVLPKPKYLGTSTTFVRIAGLIEKQFAAEHVAGNEYFKAKKVKIDWQMMLVAGIFLGALLSSLIGKTFNTEKVPSMWAEFYGKNRLVRAGAAFIGGFIALFGVRLAGGCPSGHGLSGTMQLAVSGLIAMVFFLAGGILTAGIVYKRRK